MQRERSAEDERSVTVRPTAAGEALRVQARLVPRRIAAATGLATEEVIDLRRRLHELTLTIDAALLDGGLDDGLDSGSPNCA